MVVLVDCLEDVLCDFFGVLFVEVGFEVLEVHEVPMPDCEESVDDHEEHGLDGLVVGVDG